MPHRAVILAALLLAGQPPQDPQVLKSGVEVDDPDRDGRPHRIQVKVDQRNTNVRNRASVAIPKR